jgi:hypothetical protein
MPTKILGSLLLSGAFALAEPKAEPPLPEQVAKEETVTPSVFATLSTKQHLSWIADEIPAIAGIPTIVIARADILVMCDGVDPLFLATARTNDQFYDLSDPEKYIHMIDWEASEQKLRRLFNEMALPIEKEHLDLFLENHAADLTVWTISQRASAWGIDQDGDRQKDFGIIVMPQPDLSPQESIAGLAGLGSAKNIKLTNIPGDGEDYLALVMFHEAAHMHHPIPGGENANPYDNMPLPYEIDADRKSFTAYQSAAQKGYPLDLDAIEAVKLARTAGALGTESVFTVLTMRGNLPTHTTHVGKDMDVLSLPHPHLEVLTSKDMQAMLATNLMVNFMVGMQHQFMQAEKKPDLGNGEHIAKPDAMGTIGSLDRVEMKGREIIAEHPLKGLGILMGLYESKFLKEREGAEEYAQGVEKFFKAYAPDYKNDQDFIAAKEFVIKMAQLALENQSPQKSPEPPAPASAPASAITPGEP